MKVVLAPFGSRGDVEPLVALGMALQGRGHEVVFCAPANFRAAVDASGLSFIASGPDFRGLFTAERNAEVFLASLREASSQFEAIAPVAADAHAIVGSALQFAAPTIAAMLGIPYFYALFSPMYLRSAELPPLELGERLPSRSDYEAIWRREDAELLPHAEWLGRRRRELGLPEITSLHDYLVYSGDVFAAFDPELAPPPRDVRPHFVTGAWRMAVNTTLPADVLEFLESGDAPIFVGFGSLGHEKAERERNLFVDAALAVGARVVVDQGWSQRGSGATHRDLLSIADLPHDALFPHVSAAVHHGGAGTTTAAALAGIPQLIVPQLGDQFFHAWRVAELGIGPRANAVDVPSRERAEEGIRALRNAEYVSNAQVLAARMWRSGTRAACEILESRIG